MKTRMLASAIAHEVNNRIPLRDLVPLFSYKRLRGDEPTFPNESENLRKQGFLTRDDLFAFAAWKSSRNPKLVCRNDDATVENITRAAFRLVDDADLPPSVPIAVLTLLEGVRVPTASVILTVWDPERFGIIDVNAWSALFNKTTKRALPFEPKDYDEYISILNELRELTGLTARQIDMALWAHWKIENKRRKKRAAA